MKLYIHEWFTISPDGEYTEFKKFSEFSANSGHACVTLLYSNNWGDKGRSAPPRSKDMKKRELLQAFNTFYLRAFVRESGGVS